MEHAVIPLIIEENKIIKKEHKKRFRIIKVLGVVVCIICLITSINLLNKYKEYKEIEEIFYKNSYTDNDEIKDIIKKVKEMPKKVKETLISNNINITYIPWNINEIAVYKDHKTVPVGLFDGERKRILITYKKYESKCLEYKYWVPITTFHEIGHSFDYNYSIKEYGCCYSATYEFIKIFEDEAPKLFNSDNFSYFDKNYLDYFKNNRNEYFAECFGLYFANNETNSFLKDKAPKTYDYIKDITQGSNKYSFTDFINETINK